MSQPTNPQHPAEDVVQLPVLVLTVAEAAVVARCSEASILRAIASTDPSRYPPPLTPIGRHGRGRQYLITPEELRRWIASLAQFLN